LQFRNFKIPHIYSLSEKLAEKEIFKELISIIHSFAIRLYSNRRKRMKLKYCREELKPADKHNQELYRN